MLELQGARRKGVEDNTNDEFYSERALTTGITTKEKESSLFPP
jgi:hypothetical protein